jgi:hypothetical protein
MPAVQEPASRPGIYCVLCEDGSQGLIEVFTGKAFQPARLDVSLDGAA